MKGRGLFAPDREYIMETILKVLNGLCVTGFWILVTAYGVYKLNVLKTKSWEETVYVMFRKGFEVCYEEFTGKLSPKKIINTGLILVNDEVLELVKLFNENPYMTPALAEYVPNINGIMWFDIRAVKLAPKYKDLKQRELVMMIYHIIQNFFMEKRNVSVKLYIRVATLTRLYFAVALSEEGYEFLEEQQALLELDNNVSVSDIPLEEEIDIFEEPHEEDVIC